jgi:hypothetical protein
MSTISAGTTSGTALVSAGNTDGTLQLRVNGTTPSVTLATTGAVGVGSSPSYGNSGEVLTSAGSGAAPTWVTASAGALTFISSVTASSSATVAFTSIAATYSMYMITFSRVIPATNNVRMRIRTSTDNGATYDSGASDYRYALQSYGSDTTNFSIGSNGEEYAEMQATSLTSTVTEGGLSGVMYLCNPSSSAGDTLYFWNTAHQNTSGVLVITNGAGATQKTADVDAIQFYMGSGNIASGTFRLYVIANS